MLRYHNCDKVTGNPDLCKELRRVRSNLVSEMTCLEKSLMLPCAQQQSWLIEVPDLPSLCLFETSPITHFTTHSVKLIQLCMCTHAVSQTNEIISIKK